MVKHEYRSVEFSVGNIQPFPGVRWEIKTYDHLGRSSSISSSGAWYREEGEYTSQGATNRCMTACMRYIDKILSQEI